MSQGKIAFCTTITTTMFATKAVRFVPSAMRASTATKFLRTKRTTNIAGLEIHPDPLPELVSTYTHTLNVLKGLPESAVFRQSSEAVTQQRLDIVKEAMTPTSRETVYGSEAAIDRVVAAIDAGLIEEIVDQANDEFHLATKMIDWKPYVSFFAAHSPTDTNHFRCPLPLVNGIRSICRLPRVRVTRAVDRSHKHDPSWLCCALVSYFRHVPLSLSSYHDASFETEFRPRPFYLCRVPVCTSDILPVRMLKDRWGSRSLRLSKENMRAFNACHLCLQTAQQPVCCFEGHLYCKVCILSDLLKQKSVLAEHAKRCEDRAQEEHKEAAEVQASADAERVATFERNESLIAPGSKRKHEETGDTPRKRAESSDAASSMPAFWLPNMAPQAHDQGAKSSPERASTTLCTAARPHKLLAKHLVQVHFSIRPREGQDQTFCPCCKKEYTNVSQTYVLRPCGHVFCASCTTTLVTKPLEESGKASSCPECSASIQARRDVIPLEREGTGFASGGKSEVHTQGIAFQG